MESQRTNTGLHVRVEGPFQVERDGHVAHFDPERVGAVGPLADLRQALMTEVAVLLDGGLRLSFADGRTLVVPPDLTFEAFSVTSLALGVDAFRFVSRPGGGLAEWFG